MKQNDAAAAKRLKRQKDILKKVAVALVSILLLVVFLGPFICVISASIQEEQTIKLGAFTLIPHDFTLQHYQDILAGGNGVVGFLQYIWNSVKVAVCVGLLSSVISIIAAYGLSRYRFKGKEAIAKSLLFSYAFPTILSLLPVYTLMAKTGLADTHLGLILVHTALVAPFCTWLLRSFFDAIPKEVEEAAMIDGAGRLRTIFFVLVPLVAAGLLAAGMYAITSGNLKPIPLGLSTFVGLTDMRWGRVLAACTLNFIPILILFLPLSKTFLKGFMAGAVKA